MSNKNSQTLESIRKNILNPLGLSELVEFQAKRTVMVPAFDTVGNGTESRETVYLTFKDGERIIGSISEQPDNEQPKSIRHWSIEMVDGHIINVLKCEDFALVPEKNYSNRFLDIRKGRF